MEAVKKPTTRRAAKSPVVIDSGASSLNRKPLLKQGTTWAGILSIGAAIATGGASALTDPTLLAAIGSGIALLFAEN